MGGVRVHQVHGKQLGPFLRLCARAGNDSWSLLRLVCWGNTVNIAFPSMRPARSQLQGAYVARAPRTVRNHAASDYAAAQVQCLYGSQA